MSKHTPGPWHVGKDCSNKFIVGPANSEVVVNSMPDWHGQKQAEANANLIAAAPELLKALKRIVSSAPLTGLPLALEKDIQAATVLIFKAEGNDK